MDKKDWKSQGKKKIQEKSGNPVCFKNSLTGCSQMLNNPCPLSCEGSFSFIFLRERSFKPLDICCENVLQHSCGVVLCSNAVSALLTNDSLKNGGFVFNTIFPLRFPEYDCPFTSLGSFAQLTSDTDSVIATGSAAACRSNCLTDANCMSVSYQSGQCRKHRYFGFVAENANSQFSVKCCPGATSTAGKPKVQHKNSRVRVLT